MKTYWPGSGVFTCQQLNSFIFIGCVTCYIWLCTIKVYIKFENDGCLRKKVLLLLYFSAKNLEEETLKLKIKKKIYKWRPGMLTIFLFFHVFCLWWYFTIFYIDFIRKLLSYTNQSANSFTLQSFVYHKSHHMILENG